MNYLLLSGGSGKRLWPLSNNIRSKQFLKLFKREDGSYESMVQRVFRQIKQADQDASVTIATSKTQVSLLKNQLGKDIGISVEPCRKDTFPAIALACTYLIDIRKTDENEPLVVCPVDPCAEDGYFETLKYLAIEAQKDDINLVLMGIKPTYPSEKYGYIFPQTSDHVTQAKAFIEKPKAVAAKKYITQGALWNGGVFAFKLKYILERAHELFDFKNYWDLYEKYHTLEKISFDYAIAEKEKNVQVIRYNGCWKDLGTWNTLTEAMEENIIGKGILNENCSGVHIINEMNIPVLAMGLTDVVISAGPEGILVSTKEQSSFIKPFVEGMQQQVMFAEKTWGSFRVLDMEKNYLTVKVTLNAGHSMTYHSHNHRDEIWVVVSGHGNTIVDDIKRTVCEGDIVTMKAGCRHTIIAKTELKLMEIQLGKDISVEDKQKYKLGT